MINSNGKLVKDEEAVINIKNRGYAYGDALFETIRVNSGSILFWEDHYFRLMASMRILRMQIPMQFTPEFLEEEILTIVAQNGVANGAARVKLIVNRIAGGLYTPDSNEVEYNISVAPLSSGFYTISDQKYEVTLFKDHYVAVDLLSTLKSNFFENCLLLNSNKMVVEALNGNLFLVKDNTIKTPPLSDGCLRGVLRTQLLNVLKKLPDYEIEEASISPFELQKADELFITNVITGIQPITKFRKKEYSAVVSRRILGALNAKIRLGN